jgi:hypothetical protein
MPIELPIPFIFAALPFVLYALRRRGWKFLLAFAASAPAPQLMPSGSASGGMAADAGGVKSEPSQEVKGLSAGVLRGGASGEVSGVR